MNSKKGLTAIELIISVFILSLIIAAGIPAVSSFISRIEITRTVRTITSSLNEARYLSISNSRKIRYKISDRTVNLQILKKEKWETFRTRKIKGEPKVYINSNPVFHPTGTIAPLCSVKISNSRYKYKISVSFAGRIKIKKIQY